MSIDWSATGTMLQGWATLAGAFALVYVAKTGANTFENWRKQKVAERRIGHAERILTAAYKARKALKQLRSPMMWGTELQRAEEKLKENPVEWQKRSNPENKKLITLQAYYHRLQRTHSEQNELDECLPIARALFSEEAEKAVQDLNHQFWLVQIDAESLAEDQGGDPEFTIKLRRGVSDVAPTGEVNEMTRAIDGCINTLERICLPELRD